MNPSDQALALRLLAAYHPCEAQGFRDDILAIVQDDVQRLVDEARRAVADELVSTALQVGYMLREDVLRVLDKHGVNTKEAADDVVDMIRQVLAVLGARIVQSHKVADEALARAAKAEAALQLTRQPISVAGQPLNGEHNGS